MRSEGPITPFNPLEKTKLGESVANALLQGPLLALPPDPFRGAGVYAIYYTGTHPAYRAISHPSRPDQPIYIGKAVPKGARKGHLDLDGASGDSLYQRLREHAESVDQVGLGRDHFLCRHLVVDDIWIPLGESLLIRRFRPVWNVLLDGFGNHDPGGRRVTGKISRWDTTHPGRPWVEKRHLQADLKSRMDWCHEIEQYLATGESSDLVLEETTQYSAEA